MGVRRSLELAERLGELGGHDEFRLRAREALADLFPSDTVLWTRVDLAGDGVLAERGAGPDRDLSLSITAHVRDDPVVHSYLRRPDDLTPRRITDVVSCRAWTAMPGYREAFAAVGGRHQLSLVVDLSSGCRGGGFLLLRDGSDYRDRECDLAARVLPTLHVLSRWYLALGAHHGASASCPGRDDARERWGLTDREHDILLALADGLTAAAIGRAKGISARTVSKHLERVYAKLGVHDRLLAVQRARATGLLPPPSP